MSLGMMDTAAMNRFDLVCKLLAARGRGLTLLQIGDAAALAEELEKSDPDSERVELRRARLGLEAAELD